MELSHGTFRLQVDDVLAKGDRAVIPRFQVTAPYLNRAMSLCQELGLEFDIDHIPAGTDFRQYLAETLLEASVLLAVVGPKWLGAGKSGPDRIHDEADPVRVEVETALRNGLAIVPGAPAR